MEFFPSVWFAFSALVGIAVWVIALWLAWLVVSSVRGMHTELTRIRELLAEMQLREGPGRP